MTPLERALRKVYARVESGKDPRGSLGAQSIRHARKVRRDLEAELTSLLALTHTDVTIYMSPAMKRRARTLENMYDVFDGFDLLYTVEDLREVLARMKDGENE